MVSFNSIQRRPVEPADLKTWIYQQYLIAPIYSRKMLSRVARRVLVSAAARPATLAVRAFGAVAKAGAAKATDLASVLKDEMDYEKEEGGASDANLATIAQSLHTASGFKVEGEFLAKERAHGLVDRSKVLGMVVFDSGFDGRAMGGETSELDEGQGDLIAIRGSSVFFT